MTEKYKEEMQTSEATTSATAAAKEPLEKESTTSNQFSHSNTSKCEPRLVMHIPLRTIQYKGSSPRKHVNTKRKAKQAKAVGRVMSNNARVKTKAAVSKRCASTLLPSDSAPGVSKTRINSDFDPVSRGTTPNPLPRFSQMFGRAPGRMNDAAYDSHLVQDGLKSLCKATSVTEQELTRQRGIITELTSFNENVYRYLGSLHERLERVERENASLRALVSTRTNSLRPSYRSIIDNRSRSPSPLREEPILGDNDFRITFVNENENDQNTADDSIGDASDEDNESEYGNRKTTTLENIGLPTPRTPQAQMLLTTPKNSTLLSKRSVHNLAKVLPHPLTQFPNIELTDKEILVYFFNSLVRPIVALRLRARDWGPAAMTNVLNSHRDIYPPYLRNTCSVKCTTALKRGKDKHGNQWYETTAEKLAGANDIEATVMCRITQDETDEAFDINVLDLVSFLKKHPAGEGAGVFTRCVIWCEEHQINWPLSKVNELAAALNSGRMPVPSAFPIFNDVMTVEVDITAARGTSRQETPMG
ncbi:hypothetical protein CC78DRAFT_549442 [Lojkania enalia]|uniref:Uncharacterized protein n=1 Tax=Lojkania enalia TaxID=147567 RepID=A0A9P4JYI5_9PLEO|nr:hypothetical protein CC78DRAFT_549442 [Didymosphaeria enalia]